MFDTAQYNDYFISMIKSENYIINSDISKPVYIHDCTSCNFIVNANIKDDVYDLYVCECIGTENKLYRNFVARYGNHGSEYISNTVKDGELMQRLCQTKLGDVNMFEESYPLLITEQFCLESTSNTQTPFANGEVISWADMLYEVIENYGDRGKVKELGSSTMIDRFKWNDEFEAYRVNAYKHFQKL